MSYLAAPPAPIPIPPKRGAIYRLCGNRYDLADGDGDLVAFLANFGTEPAIVIGTLAGAGWLVIVPGDAYAIGWDGSAWRALRMVQARVPASESSPSDVFFPALQMPVLDDASADAPALVCPGFLVERGRRHRGARIAFDNHGLLRRHAADSGRLSPPFFA